MYSFHYWKVVTLATQEHRSQFIELSFHVKKLEKLKQIKIKARIRKELINVKAELLNLTMENNKKHQLTKTDSEKN